MLGTLGGPELLLIFVIALIVFGPKKLPEIGKSIGKMVAEFRRASNDLKRTIEEEVEADRLRELAALPYVDLRVPDSSPAASFSTPVAPGPPAAAAAPAIPIAAGADPQLTPHDPTLAGDPPASAKTT
jgi:Tat protein translocase TatB subunit